MFFLLRTIFEWTLFIGVTGGLVDATIMMRNEAARAHQVGLISLKELNRALVGSPASHHEPSVRKR